MLGGHSMSHFLGEPWRAGPAYTNYQFVRGLSSALFLMVAGFSCVIASFGHFSDYLQWSPRMKARLRRIGLILFLGYTLQLYAPSLSLFLQHATPTNLERFLKFDVLIHIGYGLALLHLMMRLAGSERRFAVAAAVALPLFFLAAAVTYRPDVDAAIPTIFRGAVNMHHRSRFPLVPYTSFMLIGALMAYGFTRLRETPREWTLFLVGSLAGLGLCGFEWFIKHAVPGGVFPYSTPAKMMPGDTFARAGCAMLVICGLYFLGRVRVFFARYSMALSRDSLAIYFVHLFLIYGSASAPGLFPELVRKMNPWQIWSFIAGLVLLMSAMAYGIGWMRRNTPAAATRLRHSLIAAGIFGFCFWPPRGVLPAAVDLAVGALLVNGFHFLRGRFQLGEKRSVETPTRS
jgi:hypothetical protein